MLKEQKEFPESATPYIIAWVIIVTVILAILLPYLVYIPALPVLFFNAIAPPPSSPQNTTPFSNPDGLLVHYDFENYIVSSHQVVDTSGNGKNAVVQGTFMNRVPGIRGNYSLSFSGMGPFSGLAKLRSADNPAAGRNNITFSLWFRTDNLRHNTQLASAMSTGDPKSGWVIGTLRSEFWDDSGKPVYYFDETGRKYPLRAGNWTLKTITYNGDQVREYINGEEVGAWPATRAPLGKGEPMVIGGWQPFGNNFAGEIDDFRIYNRALSPEQIAGVYRGE